MVRPSRSTPTISGPITWSAISERMRSPVASFYREPRLTGIMCALSLTFLLSGSTVQHQALLVRQMRFRAMATIEIVAMLAGVATGCGLALFGQSYWSLVGQQLCAAAMTL